MSDFDLDDLNEEVEKELNTAPVAVEATPNPYMSTGKNNQKDKNALDRARSNVPTRMGGGRSYKPSAKADLFGPATQINWKTFETQRNAFEQLVKDAGIKRADLFEIGLALALKHFESKGNFDKVDRSFGTSEE